VADLSRIARFHITRDLLTLAEQSYADVEPASIGVEVSTYYLREAVAIASRLESELGEQLRRAADAARTSDITHATSPMGGR
jgi:hypothetical protein